MKYAIMTLSNQFPELDLVQNTLDMGRETFLTQEQVNERRHELIKAIDILKCAEMDMHKND